MRDLSELNKAVDLVRAAEFVRDAVAHSVARHASLFVAADEAFRGEAHGHLVESVNLYRQAEADAADARAAVRELALAKTQRSGVTA